MSKMHIDYETRSAVDLKKTGVYRYAEDATTDVWCAAFSVDDEPVGLWHPDIDDRDIRHAIKHTEIKIAHNANFERAIWRHVMSERYGWPSIEPESWRCTMAMALAMSLPGSLDGAAAALGLDIRKDATGYGQMLRMAKPRKVFPDGSITWWNEPERMERLFLYCKQDVEVERELEKRLMALRPLEQKIWTLDQLTNDKGVYVDEELCLAAKKIVAQAADRLNVRMRLVTDFEVASCTAVGQLSAFLRERGVPTDSLAKDQLDLLLARDDLPDDVRAAVELRKEAAKASVAKIDSLLAGRQRDGRARGLLQYHAASTGRWGGRRFQPQNIKRPKLENIDQAIEDVLHGNVDIIEMLYGEPLSVVGDCLRGMIKAAPGHKLIAADYANIEGRVLAWLAGEEWKLDAFRSYDAGAGPDLYKVMAGQILAKDVNAITKDERQSYGKVPELALGYQGGPGAFDSMAAVYGVNIGASHDMLCGLFPDFALKARKGWDSRGNRSGMTEHGWTAAEIVKLLWRGKHAFIEQYWWDLDAGAIAALQNPGERVTVRNIQFVKAGSFMFLRLPSGRALVYPYPKLAMKEMPWDGDDGRPAKKEVFSYKGVDSYTRKWTECYAYGGLWAENVTQAAARDLLAEACLRLDDAGYPVVLTVHDEIVAEPPIDFGSVDEFTALMNTLPPWATGLPVTAEGFSADRYRK